MRPPNEHLEFTHAAYDTAPARVIIRPETTKSESQMQAELTRIAEAVLR